MFSLRNQKGMVLITSYLVVIVLILLSGAFFARTIQESNLVQRQNDSLKALYNAEKGVAYAYFESCAKGWAWVTHAWDGDNDVAVPVSTPPAALRTSVDCQFIPAPQEHEGSYAADDGSFILKTFFDPQDDNVTIVRSMGISGDVRRVVEYRIARDSIYDFAWWSPDDLNLDDVGDNVNGGRIHANGDITMSSSKRLYGVDTISTGRDRGIYYRNNGRYYAPGRYDWYVDGSGDINGEVPLPHLSLMEAEGINDRSRYWAGTDATEPYDQDYQTRHPWKYEASPDNWRFRSYGTHLAGSWPPRDWRDEEYFFYGSSIYNSSTQDQSTGLNHYNTWLYPAIRDENGDLDLTSLESGTYEAPQEIPGELEGAMWTWQEKYYQSYFETTYGGAAQQELEFTVYDPENPENPKSVDQTRWKIDSTTGEVVMTTPDDPDGGTIGLQTYWDMLRNKDYWLAIGFSDNAAEIWGLGDDGRSYLNPEVLGDGTYGSEVEPGGPTGGQNILSVDNTNSIQQPDAWNAFLQDKGLEDVLLANERGEDMTAPQFAGTYKQKSQTGGLYLSSSGGEHTLHYGNAVAPTVKYTANITCTYVAPEDRNDPDQVKAANDAYMQCLEQSIDAIVARLNTYDDENGDPVALPEEQRVARKVKFINFYTTQTNVVLELDMGKMQDAGTFPANGIIYSEVPTRLSNADQLPYTGSSNQATFNLICTENIYLKGNYNDPVDDPETTELDESDLNWMPSALISKKFIYTLSDDFNDPGWTGYDDGVNNSLASHPEAIPAWHNYPNNPYLFVYQDAEGNVHEADPGNPVEGAFWTRGFSSGTPQQDQFAALRDDVQADWQAAFDITDPEGDDVITVESDYAIINGQTWGAKVNRVQEHQTYNALMASYYEDYYYSGDNYTTGIPRGVLLERWENDAGQSRYRYENGAYFKLENKDEGDGGFTAQQQQGVDFLDIPYNSRATSRWSASYCYWPCHNVSIGCNTTQSYDSRFRNPLLAQNKPIFFGGGESSWREITLGNF